MTTATSLYQQEIVRLAENMEIALSHPELMNKKWIEGRIALNILLKERDFPYQPILDMGKPLSSHVIELVKGQASDQRIVNLFQEMVTFKVDLFIGTDQEAYSICITQSPLDCNFTITKFVEKNNIIYRQKIADDYRLRSPLEVVVDVSDEEEESDQDACCFS